MSDLPPTGDKDEVTINAGDFEEMAARQVAHFEVAKMLIPDPFKTAVSRVQTRVDKSMYDAFASDLDFDRDRIVDLAQDKMEKLWEGMDNIEQTAKSIAEENDVDLEDVLQEMVEERGGDLLPDV